MNTVPMYNNSQQSRLRIMRLILFYDLPTDSERSRKIYTFFHGFLIKNGFYMMQQSIYGCLVRNYDFARLMIAKVKENAPVAGDVRCLLITEKQYQTIEIFVGQKSLQERTTSIAPVLEI